MAIVRAVLTAFVVSWALNHILDRQKKKSHASDPYHFTARCNSSVNIYAYIGVGLFAVLELGAYFSHQDMPTILTILLAIFVALPGLFLYMSTIPGFWEMRVDQDDVTIVKLFCIKRHWKISEIDRCVAVTGEIRVYVKGRRRMAFLVDAMFDNCATFAERMRLEGIPIIDKVRKTD